jgi:hypothetical protein
MKIKHLPILLLSILIINACDDGKEELQKISALTPVYGSLEDLKAMITIQPPRSLNSIGKIYTYNQLLLINEQYEGVHVFDNSDPTDPKPIHFIQIPGNVDIAIKDQFAYADMGVGLATINIQDLSNPVLTHFDQTYLGEKHQQRPPQQMTNAFSGDKVYFECPDPIKGMVISWEINEILKPECYIIK